jgi:hypothetical protein
MGNLERVATWGTQSTDKTPTTENTTQYRKLRRLAAHTQPQKTML